MVVVECFVDCYLDCEVGGCVVALFIGVVGFCFVGSCGGVLEEVWLWEM